MQTLTRCLLQSCFLYILVNKGKLQLSVFVSVKFYLDERRFHFLERERKKNVIKIFLRKLQSIGPHPSFAGH